MNEQYFQEQIKDLSEGSRLLLRMSMSKKPVCTKKSLLNKINEFSDVEAIFAIEYYLLTGKSPYLTSQQ